MGNDLDTSRSSNRIFRVATVVCSLLVIGGIVVLVLGQIRTARQLAELQAPPTGGLVDPTGFGMGGGALPGGATTPEGGAPNSEDALPTGLEVPAEFRALVGEDLPDVMYRVGDVEIVAAIVRMDGTDLALSDASLSAGLELYEKHIQQRFVPGEAEARLGIEAALLELLDDPRREFLYRNLAEIKEANVQPDTILEELRAAVAGRG